VVYKTSKLVRKTAKNIKKHRKTSYLKLAAKAQLNFSTLEKIIYPRVQDVQVSTLLKIATALGVGLEDLVK
jgi:DNA-binding Xre family transcriptional regulator